MFRKALYRCLLPALWLLALPVLAAEGFRLPGYPPEVLVFQAGEVAPLQPLATLAGCTLTRDLLSGQVTLTRQGHAITFAPRSTAATVDGKPLTLPLAPVVRNNILYVPLRALAAALGGTLQAEGMSNFALTLPGLSRKIVLPSRVTDGDLGAFAPTSSALYLMNADGSGLRQLTFNSMDNGIPVRSPDGSLLAYTYGGALYVRMGKIPVPVCLVPTRHEGNQLIICARPVFTADSKNIIYQEQRYHDPTTLWDYNQTMTIYSVEVVGGASVKLGDNARNISISHDGKLLAYSDWGTTHLTDLTGTDLCTIKGFYPDLSPDGTRVLYSISGVTGQTLGLYIRAGARAGTTLTMEAGAAANYMAGNFTPDGKSIVYYDNSHGLQLMDAELKNSRILTGILTAWPVDVQFSPDGAAIFFNQPYNDFGLFTINADGSGLKQLTRNMHVNEYAISPDGKQILFAASL